MERQTEMVREYTTQQEFHTDEQKLNREGWTVQPTALPDQKPGLVERIRARFMPTAAPARLVVTYTRQRPA